MKSYKRLPYSNMLTDSLWRLVLEYAIRPHYEYRFEWPYHLVSAKEAVNEIWVHQPRAFHYLLPHLIDVTSYWGALCQSYEEEVIHYLLDHPERIDVFHFADNPNPFAVSWCMVNIETVAPGNAQTYINPSRTMLQYWMDIVDSLDEYKKKLLYSTIESHHADWAISLGRTRSKYFSENADEQAVRYLLDHPQDIVAEGWIRNRHPLAIAHALPYRKQTDRNGFNYLYKKSFWTEDDVDFYLEVDEKGLPHRLLRNLDNLSRINNPRVGQWLLDLFHADEIGERYLSASPCPMVVDYLLQHPILISWDLFGANEGVFRKIEPNEWFQPSPPLPHFRSINSLPHDTPIRYMRTLPSYRTKTLDWYDVEDISDAITERLHRRIMTWKKIHQSQHLIPTVFVSEHEWGNVYRDAHRLILTILHFCQYGPYQGIKALRLLHRHYTQRRRTSKHILPLQSFNLLHNYAFRYRRTGRMRLNLLNTYEFMSHQSGHHCDGWYVEDRTMLSYAFVQTELKRFLRQFCPSAIFTITNSCTKYFELNVIVEKRRLIKSNKKIRLYR